MMNLSYRQLLRTTKQLGYTTPNGTLLAYDRLSKIERPIEREDITGVIFCDLTRYEEARALEDTQDIFGICYVNTKSFITMKAIYDKSGAWFTGNLSDVREDGPGILFADFKPHEVIDSEGRKQPYKILASGIEDIVNAFSQVLKIKVSPETVTACITYLRCNPKGTYRVPLDEKTQYSISENQEFSV